MSQTTRLPRDSDVDLHVARQRREIFRAPWAVLGAIAAGGALGALGRYAIAQAWTPAPGQVPWATFATNVSGCFLIGVLMVLITEVWSAHRLIRPFLGVGVLGGYTTFSTYAVEVRALVASGAARTGLFYLAGTVVAALAAVYAGVTLARLITRRGRRAHAERRRDDRGTPGEEAT
ncbi:fluoride efflux transporter CrcB [Mangrovihabitans endophyticus]|uniref:Fluoride-specific ion channel FluC n=1 Tax=Mangrovihabitans endophyticus TaxID=1751298 RepID=A0A8J3FM91_9ACTN|nr:fluoride efflux transporter CrcB [Mangrovihabitans endophyticus]GGK81261.1 putative fluoride ion transporter CrcB 1 [Mangrovihabitans endophyticus]